MAPVKLAVPASNLSGTGRIGGLGEGHGIDHIAPAEERRHGFEQRTFAIQHADARRAEELMPREGIEVAIQSLHVDTAVHDTLASVHHGDRPHGMCRVDDGPQVGTRSERIRSLRNGDDAGLVIQQRRQQFGAQAPLVVEGQDADFRPLRSASICQGTILEWCSISLTRILSPARTNFSPQA